MFFIGGRKSGSFLKRAESFIFGIFLVLRTTVKVSASQKNLRNLRENYLNFNRRFSFLKDFVQKVELRIRVVSFFGDAINNNVIKALSVY